MNDDSRGATYANMVKSLLGRLRVDVLYRVDINFFISKRNINSMLGRTAHTLFLDNEESMRMLIARYRVVFS